MLELTTDEARRLALRAQGVLGAPDRRGGVPALLDKLAAVQLDTISVLARSHELVAYARLGVVGRDAVEQAYWSGDAFEYWAHAACILPAAQWPLFAFRRRHYRARGWRWHEVDASACDRVLARLQAEGPMTSTDLGGSRTKPARWWDWSDVKIAVEYLLDVGEVVCSERRSWKRVYDLPERVLPPAALAVGDTLTDAECRRELVRIAGRALGVATLSDLTDFHRLKQVDVSAVLEDSGLVPVDVRGWGRPAWADPDLLAAGPPRGRHRTTLLSPFDTVVWDRARTERIFGFVHRLEAYTPAPKRVHGYFAMPLLAGGKLVGRVDPGRDGTTLVAKTVTVEPRAVDALADALREAATWVGCDRVALGDVRPAAVRPDLEQALA